ncbi:hypothetical protein FACS1894141_5790 [Spirochaetia bacterium]|nr:hypothetical protein FACS1894141_5790 [Spirochaetia bacterium]
MKKLIPALAILCSLYMVSCSGEPPNFKITGGDGNYTISVGRDKDGRSSALLPRELTIPLSEIEYTQHITSIGDFSYCGLTRVKIPLGYNITSFTIEANAFKGNPLNAIELEYDNHLLSLTNAVALDDTAITFVRKHESGFDLLIYNNSVTAIFNYSGGREALVIPAEIDGLPVVEIGDEAFSFTFSSKDARKAITSVTIPNSVTSIGDSAFKNCDLTQIDIPSGVTSIGNGAFSSNKLTNITIPKGVTVIGDRAFSGNQLTRVNIPNSVVTIGESAFSGNNLTSVNIPTGVTIIGDNAFGRNKLTSVSLPNTITDIGKEAFKENKLTSIVIPNSVITIGDEAFNDNQLSRIVIGNNVVTIGKEAFQGQSISSINIPNSVVTIGDKAFYGNPISSVVLGNNVETIGVSAFDSHQTGYKYDDSFNRVDYRYRGKITKINFPDSLVTIGEGAFLYQYLSSVVIPDNVVTIGKDAFAENTLTRVIIGNKVTTIGEGAFAGGTMSSGYKENQITNLVLGHEVRTIGKRAFADCNLSVLTIPNSVTSIEDEAFRNNPVHTVTIGSNVRLQSHSVRPDFEIDYNANGKKAGTYKYNEAGKIWEYSIVN